VAQLSWLSALADVIKGAGGVSTPTSSKGSTSQRASSQLPKAQSARNVHVPATAPSLTFPAPYDLTPAGASKAVQDETRKRPPTSEATRGLLKAEPRLPKAASSKDIAPRHLHIAAPLFTRTNSLTPPQASPMAASLPPQPNRQTEARSPPQVVSQAQERVSDPDFVHMLEELDDIQRGLEPTVPAKERKDKVPSMETRQPTRTASLHDVREALVVQTTQGSADPRKRPQPVLRRQLQTQTPISAERASADGAPSGQKTLITSTRKRDQRTPTSFDSADSADSDRSKLAEALQGLSRHTDTLSAVSETTVQRKHVHADST
jgi:hypothetical protein